MLDVLATPQAEARGRAGPVVVVAVAPLATPRAEARSRAGPVVVIAVAPLATLRAEAHSGGRRRRRITSSIEPKNKWKS